VIPSPICVLPSRPPLSSRCLLPFIRSPSLTPLLCDMPAERTRGSKRSGSQLTWTTPVEPTTAHSIAFAPNVTPVTFNDPPCIEVSGECNLFPPSNDCSTSHRPAHSKKKPANYIPRPPNAFILFRSSFIKSQHVSTEVETNHSTLSKIIGLTWQNLPHDERQVWHAKAKAALEDHKRRFPQYAFRPLHPKGKPTEKRKVREVGPKDLTRCAKIAELLLKGKKGQELDAAVQEFDRHHVPKVVTRFEAPITARMYRRSSSAPAVDATKDMFLPSPPLFGPQYLRSVSSQPTRPSSPCSPTESTFTDLNSEAGHFYDTAFTPSVTPSESYSFPSMPSPSFDFTTFSFHQGHNGVAYTGEHLTGHNATGMLHPEPRTLPRTLSSLSIDTSFVDDWSASPSPAPSTPLNYSPCESPCSQDSFSAFHALDQFHLEFNSHSIPELQLYSNDVSRFEAALPDGHATFKYPQTSKDNFPLFDTPRQTLAHSDIDFNSFMASLPPYNSM
jgi:hypothetical protein